MRVYLLCVSTISIFCCGVQVFFYMPYLIFVVVNAWHQYLKSLLSVQQVFKFVCSNALCKCYSWLTMLITQKKERRIVLPCCTLAASTVQVPCIALRLSPLNFLKCLAWGRGQRAGVSFHKLIEQQSLVCVRHTPFLSGCWLEKHT